MNTKKPKQKKYCGRCGVKLFFSTFQDGYDEYTGKKIVFNFGVCPILKDNLKDNRIPKQEGIYMGHSVTVYKK